MSNCCVKDCKNKANWNNKGKRYCNKHVKSKGLVRKSRKFYNKI